MSFGQFYILFLSTVVLAATLTSCQRNSTKCKNYVHNCSSINDSALSQFPFDSGSILVYGNGLTASSLIINKTKTSKPNSFKPCYPGTLFPGCNCKGDCTNTAKFNGSFNRQFTQTDSTFSIEFKENLMFDDIDTSIHYAVTIDLCGFQTYINYRNPELDSLIFDSTINGEFYPKLVFKFRDTNELDSGDVWNLYYSEESGIVSFQTHLNRSPYLLKPPL